MCPPNVPSVTRELKARVNGFSSMPYGLRAKCIKLADNIVAIEAWRATLPEAQRESQRHPEVVLRSWRKATAERKPANEVPMQRHVVLSGKAHNREKPISWPGDMIRSAANSMRESGSRDWIVLAKAALESLGRESLQILLDDPAPKSAPAKPRKQAPAAAMALA